MSPRDEVSLSARERELLAGLESRAAGEDPALAARLRGRGLASLRSRLKGWRLPQMPAWAGLLCGVLGLLLVVLAVSSAVWLAVPGVALVAAGGCALGAVLRERVEAREARGRPAESSR